MPCKHDGHAIQIMKKSSFLLVQNTSWQRCLGLRLPKLLCVRQEFRVAAIQLDVPPAKE